MESWELNFNAAWDYLKGVAARIGKTYEWCRRQCHPPAGEHPDYYGAFLIWWYAILAVNPAGADLYIHDLIARRDAARDLRELADADWSEMVAQTTEECARGIAEATRRGDATTIATELSKAQAAIQRLLALNRAAASGARIDAAASANQRSTELS